MSAPEYGAAEGCGALVLGWFLGWGSGAVRAAVAMKGWEWFVADTFGVPLIGFIEAWGISLLVSFATMRPDTARDDRNPFTLVVTGVVVSLALSGMVFVSLLILAGLR